MPNVLVIIVNYNGRGVIEPCLESLRDQDYERFRVLVIDNASTDGSDRLIEEKYPWVTVDRQQWNLGFAEGNNVGLREALTGDYDYVALLNSDATASRNWLTNLIANAEQNRRVGIVSAKLVLWEKYVPITFKVQTVSPKDAGINKNDTRHLGIRLESNVATAECTYDKMIFGSGWWSPETDGVRWSNETSHCYVPYSSWKDGHHQSLSVCFKGRGVIDNQPFSIEVAGKRILQSTLSKKSQVFIFSIPANWVDSASVDILNNYGSAVDEKGYGHDVGFGLPDNVDLKPYVADAFCGANALISVEALRNVGLFDERYFMYYEDIDLSLRMRKAGYKILISPNSMVRHYHSASGGQNSKVAYYIQRNRLWILTGYGSEMQIFIAWIRTNGALLRSILRFFSRMLLLRPGVRAQGRAVLENLKISFALWVTPIVYRPRKSGI